MAVPPYGPATQNSVPAGRVLETDDVLQREGGEGWASYGDV